MPQKNLWDQVDGDLYAILAVDQSASADEIVVAWRATAKRLHPDLGGSATEFQQAEIAYEVLSNPLERHRYDRYLAMTRGPSSSYQRTATYYRTTTNWQPTQRSAAQWSQADPSGTPPGAEGPGWNPWAVVFAVLLILAAIVAAFMLAIVTPLLLIGLAIWLVGRTLNPRKR